MERHFYKHLKRYYIG